MITKRKFLAAVFCLIFILSTGQNRVEGVIHNDKGNPLPYCALALLNSKDSSQVKGNITNENGSYLFEEVPTGIFIIKSSAAGFESGFSGLLVIDSLSKINVEPVILKTKAVNLNEVSVSVLKKPIEFKNGNITFNVEGSPLAIGNSVYDLLMRMPGVLVDGDNISLAGRGAARFLIDDRLQQISGSQMTGILKSMNASMVEKIEIINNPSAKYDASGSGGLINIKTKKVKITGFSGSVMNNFSQGFYANSFGQLSLNYKGKKFSTFTNFNYSYADRRGVNTWRREVKDDSLTTILTQDYVEKSMNRYVSFFGGADWYINSKNTLSVRADLRPGKELVTRNSITTISNNSLGYDNLAFEYEKPNDWFWQDYSINYEYVADTLGTKLTFNSSYSTYPDNYDGSYKNHYLNSEFNDILPVKIFRNSNSVELNALSARFDFEKNFGKKVRLEAGIKASQQGMLSDFTFENFIYSTNQYSIDSSLTNRFLYRELITAGYIDLSKEYRKFNFRFGLRGENTLINAESKTSNINYDREYFNLFPSASVDYNRSDRHNYGLSYNKRIDRPDYNNFNPFKAFRSLLTYLQGNPYLNPLYTDRVELRHTFKGKITNSISYYHAKNYFVSYNREDVKTKELTFYNGNIDKGEILSYSFFIQTDLFKWWTLNANQGIHYFRCNGDIDGKPYGTSALNMNTWFFNQFSLSKTTKMEISFWGVSPWVDGVTSYKPRGSLSIGLKQNFLKDKLTISFGCQDVLYTEPVISQVKFHNQFSQSTHQYDSRRFYINVNYNFGKIKVQQKNVKTDDGIKERVGK